MPKSSLPLHQLDTDVFPIGKQNKIENFIPLIYHSRLYYASNIRLKNKTHFSDKNGCEQYKKHSKLGIRSTPFSVNLNLLMHSFAIAISFHFTASIQQRLV